MFRTLNTILGIIFLSAALMPLNVRAQGDSDNVTLANDFVQMAEEIMASTKAMIQARDMYVQAAQLDPNNIVANYKAGEFYLETVGKDQAAQYFERVFELDPEYRFDIFYWTGRSYQYGMNFEKALDFYQKYKERLEARPGYRGLDMVELKDVNRRIYECENALKYVANPSNHSIINVGSSINSPEDEYGPVLNADENLLIFTSRRREGNLNENVDIDNKPFEDIYFSEKVNGVWSPAQNIGTPVNSEYHDSNLALSASGDELYLYTDDNNGDIMVSYREGDAWTEPESLSDNINSEGFWEGSISISPDKKVLFFASNRIGGYGGIDIYYSIRNDKGDWEKSRNLGPKINTEFDDDAPFIDYDGKTLYFSTMGREGMGGHDIFYTVYDSAEREWSDPINLGFPINTPDNDIYFVSTKDGKRGYYASVREDGLGFTDIYEVMIKKADEPKELIAKNTDDQKDQDEPETDEEMSKVDEENTITSSLMPVKLFLTVVDGGTGESIDATVSIRRKSDNVMAGQKKLGTGEYEFTIQNEVPSEYLLSVEKDGYAFENTTIKVPQASSEIQRLQRKVSMRKLSTGTRSVLRNIYFDFNKATFAQESYNELNKLERMMQQNPNLVIEISGHTDNIGSASYNKQLSQRRANAVKQYLVSKGVDPRRIESVGYGEERPLASNDDELEGRELNRRVEFKVIN